MKALVLSGGWGTRLRPLSYSMPKQLIPLANKPVLEHALETIRALGVTEIGIIVGDWGAEIAAVIGDGTRLGVPITYIRQDQPLGLAHCVTLARPFLGDDDFVMYLGDNILPDGVNEIADEFRHSRPAAQIVLHKVPDPRAFGVAELDESGAVIRLVEKPQQPRSDLAMIGVYFFTAAIHDAVAAITVGARGELEITDAIACLLDRGTEVKASVYDGYWKDAGRVEDILECNRRLLSAQRRIITGDVDATSVVGANVIIEAGARVVRSRIDGPAIIGANCVIEDSHLGPNTAIGPDCVLRESQLTDSIVLTGASIERARGLHGSLIGRFTTISPSESRRRLVVGDHTRIELTM